MFLPQSKGIGGLASRGGPMDSFKTAVLAKTKTDIAKKELLLVLVLLSIPYQIDLIDDLIIKA